MDEYLRFSGIHEVSFMYRCVLMCTECSESSPNCLIVKRDMLDDCWTVTFTE